jgi:PEGA domain-containing protein
MKQVSHSDIGRSVATRRMGGTRSTYWVALGIVVCSVGCVRRTITIETTPTGGTVFLNDEEIGQTPVSRDFTWYGDYDVVIRKDGHRTLGTNVEVFAPWYQIPPIDLFADVFWPGRIHDHRRFHFTLDDQSPTDADELIVRAVEMRARTLDEPD